MEAYCTGTKMDEVTIQSSHGIPDALMGGEKHLKILIPPNEASHFIYDEGQNLQSLEMIAGDLYRDIVRVREPTSSIDPAEPHRNCKSQRSPNWRRNARTRLYDDINCTFKPLQRINERSEEFKDPSEGLFATTVVCKDLQALIDSRWGFEV